jgi:hypothetical protein
MATFLQKPQTPIFMFVQRKKKQHIFVEKMKIVLQEHTKMMPKYCLNLDNGPLI